MTQRSTRKVSHSPVALTDEARERMSAISVMSGPSRAKGPSTKVSRSHTHAIVKEQQYSVSMYHP